MLVEDYIMFLRRQIREVRHKYHLISICNLSSWLLLSLHMSSTGITVWTMRGYMRRGLWRSSHPKHSQKVKSHD